MTNSLRRLSPALPALERVQLDSTTAEMGALAAVYEEEQDIGYTSALWAQLSMPYRNPGNIAQWTRSNGNLTLTVTAHPEVSEDGQVTYSYPYGVIPRYVMLWVAGEVFRTEERTLSLGSTVADFAQKLGMKNGGTPSRRLAEQLRNLFACSMSIEEISQVSGEPWELNETVTRVRGSRFNIASEYELFQRRRQGRIARLEDPVLFGSTLTVTEDFFDEIMRRPVPIDLNTINKLQGSPLKIDVYTWLTYRMSYLRSPSFIPWSLLALQFGSMVTRPRGFKEYFLKALADVLMLYPEARVKAGEHNGVDGLQLLPSPPHIRKRPATRVIRTATNRLPMAVRDGGSDLG